MLILSILLVFLVFLRVLVVGGFVVFLPSQSFSLGGFLITFIYKGLFTLKEYYFIIQ